MARLTQVLIGIGSLALVSACASYTGPAPVAPLAADAGATAGERCAALAGMKLDNVQFASADLIADGAKVPNAFLPDMTGLGQGAAVSGLPDFCRIAGIIRPEPGSIITFEVWLPADGWNGRFLAAGNGGFAGSISYMDMVSALKSGHATASSDTGHAAHGMASDWAKGNPAKIRDYGWRAVHETTVSAKTLLAAFYGRSQDKAYFNSCSNGGRQALMEASRFPDDYDGIIAGAPAAPFTKLAMSMMWTQQVQLPEGAALSAKQIGLINDETLRQCDSIDGLEDGLVDDPRQCRIDFTKYACGTNESPQCLSGPQVDALRKMQAGPRNSAGELVAHPYLLSGGERGNPAPQLGWENWIVRKDSVSPFKQPANHIFPEGLLKDFVAEPFATIATFDWDTDPKRFERAVASNLDPKPTLKPFFDKGGKLIIWHGWSDAAIPALNAIEFYQEARRSGGAKAAEAMKLFLIPGVQHCAGGPGASSFGQMFAPEPADDPARHMGRAMQTWVEDGRSPESVVGTFGFSMMPAAASAGPVRERLHCAFPARAKLVAGGDRDRAASYRCVKR